MRFGSWYAGWMNMSCVSFSFYPETTGTAKEQPRLDGQPMETTRCSTHSPARGSERRLAVEQLSQALEWGHADFPKGCGPVGYRSCSAWFCIHALLSLGMLAEAGIDRRFLGGWWVVLW